MRGFRRTLWVWAALFACAGCALFASHKWYGNRRALDSTLERPVLGDPERSTFVDPSAEGASFASVRVLPPSVRSTRGDEPEEREMQKRLALLVEDGLRQVAEDSGRFKAVAGGEEPAETLLSAEVLFHVSTVGGVVKPDPVLNDPRSKLFAVFTLKEAATGRVLMKYTAIARATWEYAPSVMGEMDSLAAGAVKDLAYVLHEM